MNWKQLYASATPEEHLEALVLMLRTLEARRYKLMRGVTLSASRGRRVRFYQRGPFPGVHTINQRHFKPRPVLLASFMFIVATMSVAVWLSFFHLPPNVAAPLMLFHLVSLFAILLIKPRHPRSALVS